MAQLQAGSLLVAAPALQDPNFVDSVVLMLDSDDDGALGVILNRPTPMEVGEVLAPWADAVTAPPRLFRGGPVGPDAALAVALLRDPADAPLGFRIVAGRLGLLDLDTPTELVTGSLDALRVFVGYAGWGGDQLAGEVAAGDWYVLDGEESDPFHVDPAGLWRDVLRRQSGDLAWHSTRPADPELN